MFRTITKILLFMALGLSLTTCCVSRKTKKAPKEEAPKAADTVIYCSYASSGSAGLGKEYCEFIADPGTEPKVVVNDRIGNRFGDPEIHKEYPISEDKIAELEAIVSDRKVKKLDGYDYEEPITGGYAHRVHIEYASGQSVTFRFYGHNVKQLAYDTFRQIELFFYPWLKQAQEEVGEGEGE